MRKRGNSLRAGLVVILIGVVAWCVGLVGESAGSGDDGANIGAPIAQFVGYGLIGLGLVVVAVSLVASRRR